MNQTITVWDNLPSLFAQISKAIWTCISSIITVIILTVISLIWCGIVGACYGYGESGPGQGFIIPVMTFIVAFASALGIDFWFVEKMGGELGAKRAFWIIFGPTTLAITLVSFTFYPLKKKAVLIDQTEIKNWTLAIPFRGNIAVIQKEQRLQANLPATTNDNIRVRGDISASFLITGDPAKWISDEALQKNAEEELGKHFMSIVAQMSSSEIHREIVIEFGVAEQARLENLGLKWKPGSVIKVSNIHAAAPES